MSSEKSEPKQLLLDTLKYFCYGLAFGVGIGISGLLVPSTIDLYFPQVDPALESLAEISQNLIVFAEQQKTAQAV